MLVAASSAVMVEAARADHDAEAVEAAEAATREEAAVREDAAVREEAAARGEAASTDHEGVRVSRAAPPSEGTAADIDSGAADAIAETTEVAADSTSAEEK